MINDFIEAFERITFHYNFLKRQQGEDNTEVEKRLFNEVKLALDNYKDIIDTSMHYHWEDLANDVFKIETDRKWQLKFESAICDVQEDYKKARLYDIIRNKGIMIHMLKITSTVEQYNAVCNPPYVYPLTKEEYTMLKMGDDLY